MHNTDKKLIGIGDAYADNKIGSRASRKLGQGQ